MTIRSIACKLMPFLVVLMCTACYIGGDLEIWRGMIELPALTGTVTVSGTAEVGQTLTANTENLGGKGTISYQWKRGSANVGSNSSTYTIAADDAGSAITVTVKRSENSGSVTSEPTAVITGITSNQTPVASDFDIGNLTQTVGSIIAVTVTPKTGKSPGAITIRYNGLTTLPTTVGTHNITFDVAAATGWNAAAGLDGGTLTINATNQNPAATDFDIGNLTQAAGSVTAVTITPKVGKSAGSITILYNGSSTLPTTVGTYTVTFDVAAATGWNAVTGLAVGNLVIGNPAPVADDFNVSNLDQTVGSVTAVIIMPRMGKSTGTITIRYDGSTILPTAAGTYTVTFDVAVTEGWSAAAWLSGGTLSINQNPAATDFDIGNVTQTYGSVTAVTITPRAGKSAGLITIRYNGSTTLPTTAGTYTVTFNVAAAPGWNAVTELAGGTLTINKASGAFGSPAVVNTTYTPTLTLANLSLPTGYAWNTPATGLNAGNGQQFPATYTDPGGNYTAANGNITVNVAKATGVFGSPDAINITYTPTLTLASLSLSIGYAWNAPATGLNAGNGQQFPAAYTDPGGNYTAANGNIIVNVAKAPGVFGSPDAINITYTPTLTLANLSLPAGYIWNTPATGLNVGNGQQFPASYTDPGGNYTAASGNVTVNVAEAIGNFGSPAVINTMYTPTLTLANLSLPTDYAWNVPATSLNAGNGQQFPAAYTDPSGNYNPANGNITVNVAKAAGATVATPTLASKTSNSITVNVVTAPESGQNIEYACTTANTEPASGWQTGLTFSGLSAGTTYYIFARSAANNNYHAGTAVSTAMVTLVQEDFAITLALLDDLAPDITGPSIRLIGSAAETVKTITINNPSQYEIGSIKWFYDGKQITTSAVSGSYGETLSLNSTIYNKIGTHYITVGVTKDGKVYSKVISFTVTL